MAAKPPLPSSLSEREPMPVKPSPSNDGKPKAPIPPPPEIAPPRKDKTEPPPDEGEKDSPYPPFEVEILRTEEANGFRPTLPHAFLSGGLECAVDQRVSVLDTEAKPLLATDRNKVLGKVIVFKPDFNTRGPTVV